jgi:two-component system NtrC family response regulator
LECLEQYDWPGNVRELVNTLETALAQALDSPTLYPLHLPAHLRLSGFSRSKKIMENKAQERSDFVFARREIPNIREFRAEMDASYLRNLIAHTNGKVKEAAKIAGLSESRMHALLNKHGAPRMRK